MTATTSHVRLDTHGRSAGVVVSSNGNPPPASDVAASMVSPLGRAPFDELRTLAEAFADAQKTRISLENRLRSGTVPGDLSDDLIAAQRHTEDLIGRAMVRSFRKAAPEIRRWVTATKGLGEPSVARLVGIIGHPVIARPHHWEETGQPHTEAQAPPAGFSQSPGTDNGHDPCDNQIAPAGPSRVLVADPPYERTVSQLWAYCGHGDPARRKRKGMDASDAMGLGNPRAKMVAHLIAENAIKEPGRKVDLLRAGGQQPGDATWPYRRLYEETRVRYWIDHTEWPEGHQHNSAIHLVAKEILRDLWVETRQADSHSKPMGDALEGSDARQTTPRSRTSVAASGGLDLVPTDQGGSEAQAPFVGEAIPSTSHGPYEIQSAAAGAGVQIREQVA
jgi:hypothetical protein